jgi:hypothetical protein
VIGAAYGTTSARGKNRSQLERAGERNERHPKKEWELMEKGESHCLHSCHTPDV